MTRKKWFRLYHGLAHDMALAVAAQHAQISRGDMIALWLCLLDHASQSTPAGAIAQFEKDETALLLGLSPQAIENALTALRARKKIDSHQRIVGWDKYQPSSTERVRAMRARRQASVKPAAPPPPPPVRKNIDNDSPAAIAARRARLQHNKRTDYWPALARCVILHCCAFMDVSYAPDTLASATRPRQENPSHTSHACCAR